MTWPAWTIAAFGWAEVFIETGDIVALAIMLGCVYLAIEPWLDRRAGMKAGD